MASSASTSRKGPTCGLTTQFDRLLQTLTAWRVTAEAVAAGYLHDEHLAWIVARPR